MTTTPDPKIVHEIAQQAMAEMAFRYDAVGSVLDARGLAYDEYAATVIAHIDAATIHVSWPDEQPQDERDAALADLATELDAANDDADEIADRAGAYREEIMQLRAQVRELKAAQESQDDQCAWHELRLFSGPALLDEGDVEQHELTHPEQCSTLPPGAACWAEHQPFRWWWPTEHGTYRIRPEDVLTGGSEDGPEYETTLRVQVLRDGEWFEYSNDIIGANPADETPAIRERLKAALDARDAKAGEQR